MNDMPINEDRRIDRLVDGELSPSERRDLLASLEAEPGGWKRCATAFLEAQAWHEALGPVGESARPVPTVVTRPPFRLKTLSSAAGLAASLLLAFGVGWASRGEAGAPPSQVARDIPKPPAEARVRVAPEPAEVTEPPPKPDPIVTELASRGYQVDRRKRVVTQEAEDGRRVAVPVEEVRLRYIGDRIY